MSETLTIDRVAHGLRTVAINGAYNASRALSKWFHRGIRLTTEGFECVPLSEAASLIGNPEEPVAAVYLPLGGEVSGHMLLTFPEDVGLAVVDWMMEQPLGTAKEFDELAQSCLQETGNIVCSAYANSLSKWLRLQVEPAVPRFTHDMACSVVDTLMMTLAADQDHVFVAATDFLMDQQRLRWGLLLLPSPDSLRLMERQCQSEYVRERALQTIAVNGAFQASRAVSKWLKRGVKISTDGFAHVPLKEVDRLFPDGKPIIALHMPLGDQLSGHTLLAVSQEDALKLADLLLGREVGTGTAIGDMERSCLEETGNIITSAFVNSWATWLDVRIGPSSPSFVLDLPQAVLQSVISEQAALGDEIFFARTDFLVDDQWLEWVFLLLPSPSAMRLIETSCS